MVPIDIVLVPGLTPTSRCSTSCRDIRPRCVDWQGSPGSSRSTSVDRASRTEMSGAPSLEQRMDDVRAVMDEIGVAPSGHRVLFGRRLHERAVCGHLSRARIAPHLVRRLFPRRRFVAEGIDAVANGGAARASREELGQLATSSKPCFRVRLRTRTPWPLLARMERLCSTPGGIRTILLLNAQINVTSVLPTIQVPTLVHAPRLRTSSYPSISAASWQRKFPGARYIEYAEGDHGFLDRRYRDVGRRHRGIPDWSPGHRHSADLERILATVMFTDIVDSTQSGRRVR